jgi:hypothetical protein
MSFICSLKSLIPLNPSVLLCELFTQYHSAKFLLLILTLEHDLRVIRWTGLSFSLDLISAARKDWVLFD